MIAAIYARKSTEQTASEEQKSVARQVAIAREHAEKKGWTIAESCIWTDDAISGAEFVKRPGFASLMDAIRSTPPFTILILYDLSRLGRDQFHTLAALNDIVEAGVAVAQVMEDRTITPETLDDEVEVLILQVKQFSNTKVRRDASKKVYDAMRRKAQALHSTGGRCYGYANEDVTEPGADGRPRRICVKKVVNPQEADVVRRIFGLYVQGFGIRRIAHTLNEEGIPAPRPTRNGPRGWSPSAIHAMLTRDTYRGIVVWGRSKQVVRRGTRKQEDRSEAEWLRVNAPELRIVPDDLWEAVQDRLREARAVYLRAANGRLWGRPVNGIASKYLLSGFGVCGLCGGALSVRPWKGRVLAYQCLTHATRGPKICPNNRPAPMQETNTAVLELLADTVLRPEVVTATVEETLRRLRPSVEQQRHERTRLLAELTQVETELARLTQAVVAGGPVSTLVEAIKDRERRREAFKRNLDALDRLDDVADLDTERLKHALKDMLADWRALLTHHLQQGRQILRKILDGRLRFTPTEEGYAFEGTGRLEPVLAGVIDLPKALVELRGFEPLTPRLPALCSPS